MSPSRRRAIGAVRGLASRALSPAPLAITHAHYPGGAMVGRRASRLAPYRHYTRAPSRTYRPSGLPTPAPSLNDCQTNRRFWLFAPF